MLSRCAVKGSLGLMPVGKGASTGVPALPARPATPPADSPAAFSRARARPIAVLARAGAMGNLRRCPAPTSHATLPKSV